MSTGPPKQPSLMVEVTILSLSGSSLQLCCAPTDAVSDLKRLLVRATGVAWWEQKLVSCGLVLKDDDTLAPLVQGQRAWPSAADDIPRLRCVLHFVRVRSGVAQRLEQLRDCGEADIAIQASLADVAGPVTQFEAALSDLVRPSAKEVMNSIVPQNRNEVVSWMVDAFDILQFDDAVLHSVVLNFDRYAVSRGSAGAPVQVDAIQRVVLAMVCIELKLANQDEFPHGHWQRVLSHLCHGRLELRFILMTEAEVLWELGWRVGAPTAVTFLREFCIRPGLEPSGASAAFSLALFLLEIALFDPAVQYAQPHPVLAAGALSAALRALDAAQELREGLMEDLAAISPNVSCPLLEAQVLDCEEQLVALWHANATGSAPWTNLSGAVVNKFSRSARQCVARLPAAQSEERLRLLRSLRPSLGASVRAGHGDVDASADKALCHLEEDRRVLVC